MFLMFRLFIFVNLIGILGVSVPSFASEGGGEKKEAAKEGKEGKEGEKKEAKPDKKEDSWQAVSAKVAALKAKVESHKKNMEGLIEQKAHAHDEAQVAEILKKLVSEHKAYTEVSKEYEKERAFLMYRFPEKGVKGERQYERVEVKNLEEMEKQMSLEGKVKGVLTKVRKQFPLKDDEEAKKKKNKEGLSEEDERLSTPVIYSK